MPDPESPEWTVVRAAKRALRLHLGPRVKRFLPISLAEEIVKALRDISCGRQTRFMPA